jgi:hypothetical protein
MVGAYLRFGYCGIKHISKNYKWSNLVSLVILIGGLIGPVYFGLKGVSFWAAIGWAVLISLIFMWDSKETLLTAKKQAFGVEDQSKILPAFATFMIFVSVTTVNVGVHMLIYHLFK